MQIGLGIIFIAVFAMAFVKTLSFRGSISETVWFSAGYLAALLVIYVAEAAGYQSRFVTTSPTGAGGAVALVIGFLTMWRRHRQWKKEKARAVAAKAATQRAERERRVAAGLPAERSLVGDAFRLAGSIQRARRRTDS